MNTDIKKMVCTLLFLEDIELMFKKVIDAKFEEINITRTETSTLPDLLTRQQTANLFSISLVCLNEWTKKGYVQSHKIGGRVLYRRDEVLNSLTRDKNLKYKRR